MVEIIEVIGHRGIPKKNMSDMDVKKQLFHKVLKYIKTFICPFFSNRPCSMLVGGLVDKDH